MSEIYYPYNETFKRYHELPLAGKRATAFIEKRNQEKSGFWVLHTVEQYMGWYKLKGKFLEQKDFVGRHGMWVV